MSARYNRWIHLSCIYHINSIRIQCWSRIRCGVYLSVSALPAHCARCRVCCFCIERLTCFNSITAHSFINALNQWYTVWSFLSSDVPYFRNEIPLDILNPWALLFVGFLRNLQSLAAHFWVIQINIATLFSITIRQIHPFAISKYFARY